MKRSFLLRELFLQSPLVTPCHSKSQRFQSLPSLPHRWHASASADASVSFRHWRCLVWWSLDEECEVLAKEPLQAKSRLWKLRVLTIWVSAWQQVLRSSLPYVIMECVDAQVLLVTRVNVTLGVGRPQTTIYTKLITVQQVHARSPPDILNHDASAFDSCLLQSAALDLSVMALLRVRPAFLAITLQVLDNRAVRNAQRWESRWCGSES
jgi:hypothetical protein